MAARSRSGRPDAVRQPGSQTRVPVRGRIGQVSAKQFITAVTAQDDFYMRGRGARDRPDRHRGRIGERIVEMACDVKELPEDTDIKPDTGQGDIELSRDF